MLATSSAERQVVLATWAVKSVLWQIKSADWARRHLFRFILGLDGSTSDALNLRLELGWDLHDVLRSDQHAGPVVGHALKARLGALTDRRRHDVARVLREERDVVADTDQESGGAQMVAVLHQTLSQLV